MTSRSQPVGLGDSTKKAEYVITKEEYPLPDTRKGIIDLFTNVLQVGGVQKVVVELKKPMEVYRAVPKDEAQGPTDSPEDDLYLQVTEQSEIHEFNFSSNPTSHEHLFRAFSWMSARHLKPKAILAHSDRELRKWLEVDEVFPLEEVYGVEVKTFAELPEDVVLLFGTAAGQERADASLRMSMNLLPEK